MRLCPPDENLFPPLYCRTWLLALSEELDLSVTHMSLFLSTTVTNHTRVHYILYRITQRSIQMNICQVTWTRQVSSIVIDRQPCMQLFKLGKWPSYASIRHSDNFFFYARPYLHGYHQFRYLVHTRKAINNLTRQIYNTMSVIRVFTTKPNYNWSLIEVCANIDQDFISTDRPKRRYIIYEWVS